MWKNDWIRQEKEKVASAISKRLNLNYTIFAPEAVMTPSFDKDGMPCNLLEISDGIYYGYEKYGKMDNPVEEIVKKKYKTKRVSVYCYDFYTAALDGNGNVVFHKHHSDIPVLLENDYHVKTKADKSKVLFFTDLDEGRSMWNYYTYFMTTKKFRDETERIIRKYEIGGKTQRIYKYKDTYYHPLSVMSSALSFLDVHPLNENGYTFQRFEIKVQIENGKPVSSGIELVNFIEFVPGSVKVWDIKDGEPTFINPKKPFFASGWQYQMEISSELERREGRMNKKFTFDGLVRKTIAPKVSIFEERNFINTAKSIYNKPLNSVRSAPYPMQPLETSSTDLVYRAFRPFEEGGDCIIPEFILSWSENGYESYGLMYFWATVIRNEGITEEQFKKLIRDSRFKFLMFAFGSADEYWLSLSRALDKAKLDKILDFVFYSGIKLGKTIQQTMRSFSEKDSVFDEWLEKCHKEVL